MAKRKAETENFHSIKSNVLGCWARSQTQCILQHERPAHLETVRMEIISTQVVIGKRVNFFLKKHCHQNAEQHWGKISNCRSEISSFQEKLPDDFPSTLQDLSFYGISCCHQTSFFQLQFHSILKMYFYNIYESPEPSQTLKRVKSMFQTSLSFILPNWQLAGNKMGVPWLSTSPLLPLSDH